MSFPHVSQPVGKTAFALFDQQDPISLRQSPSRQEAQPLSCRIHPLLLNLSPLVDRIKKKIMYMWIPKPFILAVSATLSWVMISRSPLALLLTPLWKNSMGPSGRHLHPCLQAPGKQQPPQHQVRMPNGCLHPHRRESLTADARYFFQVLPQGSGSDAAVLG